jgi:hypothetical protein
MSSNKMMAKERGQSGSQDSQDEYRQDLDHVGSDFENDGESDADDRLENVEEVNSPRSEALKIINNGVRALLGSQDSRDEDRQDLDHVGSDVENDGESDTDDRLENVEEVKNTSSEALKRINDGVRALLGWPQVPVKVASEISAESVDDMMLDMNFSLRSKQCRGGTFTSSMDEWADNFTTNSKQLRGSNFTSSMDDWTNDIFRSRDESSGGQPSRGQRSRGQSSRGESSMGMSSRGDSRSSYGDEPRGNSRSSYGDEPRGDSRSSYGDERGSESRDESGEDVTLDASKDVTVDASKDVTLDASKDVTLDASRESKSSAKNRESKISAKSSEDDVDSSTLYEAYENAHPREKAEKKSPNTELDQRQKPDSMASALTHVTIQSSASQSLTSKLVKTVGLSSYNSKSSLASKLVKTGGLSSYISKSFTMSNKSFPAVEKNITAMEVVHEYLDTNYPAVEKNATTIEVVHEYQEQEIKKSPATPKKKSKFLGFLKKGKKASKVTE